MMIVSIKPGYSSSGAGEAWSFAKFEACEHRKFINGTYFERGDDNLFEYYRII